MATGFDMITLIKKLWAHWQQVQKERAEFYTKYSGCWE
jgi:hypothetical protein